MKEVDRAEGRRALEALQKDIDDFDRAVAEHLDEETERADLWTEIEVNAETLRSALTCLKALLADPWRPIEEMPHDGNSYTIWIEDSDIGPHEFSPVSRDEEGGWWDDALMEKIKPPIGATHFRVIEPPGGEG